MKKINYKTETNVTLDEFKKGFKIIPKNYWLLVLHSMFLWTIIFTIWIIVDHADFIFLIIAEIIGFLLMTAIHKFTIDDKAQKIYKKLSKDKTRDNSYTLCFYNDKLEKISEHLSEKIDYQNIKNIIETDTNFYLYLGDRLIIVEKCNCDLELISFIREIDSQKYVNKIGFEKTNKKNNKKIIKILSDVLFTITILTIFFAISSVNVVGDYLDTPSGASLLINMWVFWLWLPIPILSIIFGFKYHKREFDCSKNIVAGVFVAIILLLFGGTSLLEKQLPYENVKKYENIIDVTLPDDAMYTSGKYDNYRGSKIIGNVKFNQIYFNGDEKNFDIFEEEVINSEKWIKGSELDDSFEIFIDSQNKINKNTYYLIYNVSTSEYNTIPKNDGIYQIYLMMYYKNLKTLNILEFEFKMETAEKNTVTSSDELTEVNNKIIEYFTLNDVNDYENYSYNYIDGINGVVIVGLLDNSEEEQSKFRKLVVDSDLIKFEKGKRMVNEPLKD